VHPEQRIGGHDERAVGEVRRLDGKLLEARGDRV
jgi:hypothetical protein